MPAGAGNRRRPFPPARMQTLPGERKIVRRMRRVSRVLIPPPLPLATDLLELSGGRQWSCAPSRRQLDLNVMLQGIDRVEAAQVPGRPSALPWLPGAFPE